MRFSLVFAALLCFTTWMSTVHATNGPVASCCLQWSNTLQRVPLENIVNYTLQTVGLCPIKAVVFETKRGKRICSDPDSARAKKVILKVDKEKETKEPQDKPQTEARSASTIAPAVSSTSKNLFDAKNGTSIYSDPDNEGTTKAMQEVDKEEEKIALQDKPQTESKSASTIAPAVSSASKNLFEAKNGTSVYSDPDNEGATKAMQEVDKEEEKTALQDKPQTEARSASTNVPAVSSTSKNAPQSTRSYRRRRQRKRSKGLRNWQRRLA
ncbi:uncharacterized protein LOC126408893 isoform X3 [Epinephelus moara]|uniref:uncharacterized protein LOC126408893 isoform X3 n=1 Tax=Epinephelus moara TaxID=300413 RepID=UPI00214E2458|nr:uncharacterized protein LOC126408893 isoform X3 [Epinephelus moara]